MALDFCDPDDNADPRYHGDGLSRQDAARTCESGKCGFTPAASEANKGNLDNALGDLNFSTNRLRGKFDPTFNHMESPHANGACDG